MERVRLPHSRLMDKRNACDECPWAFRGQRGDKLSDDLRQSEGGASSKGKRFTHHCEVAQTGVAPVC